MPALGSLATGRHVRVDCVDNPSFDRSGAVDRRARVGRKPTGGMSGCEALWIQDRCGCAATKPMGATTAMNSVAIFWLQLATSLFVFSVVAVWYVWPYLTKLSRHSALVPLLFVHVPRYVGMTLLVPGMVDPNLPMEFLSSAAYGDLLEAALALASIYALRSSWRFAIPLVWVTNTWGFLDLLSGVRGVLQLNVPSFNLATSWYIYTFYAPLVVVSHLMIFVVLVKSKAWKH
ncbi:MAG: hypothetical protein P4M05_25500 [Bradyrhizobium sp.]|nr:hypothetical protein [Bradyrhizobium sp.]